MKPSDDLYADAPIRIRRWGGRLLSVWEFRIYVSTPDESAPDVADYVTNWKLDCGPLSFDLPRLRWRKDLHKG